MTKSRLIQALLASFAVLLTATTLPNALANEKPTNEISIYLRDTMTKELIDSDVHMVLSGKKVQFTKDNMTWNDSLRLDHGYGVRIPTPDTNGKVTLNSVTATGIIIPTFTGIDLPVKEYKHINVILATEPIPHEYVGYHYFEDGHKIYDRDIPHDRYVVEYALKHNVSWTTGVDKLPLTHPTYNYPSDKVVTSVEKTEVKGDTINIYLENVKPYDIKMDEYAYHIKAIDKDTKKEIVAGEYTIATTYSSGLNLRDYWEQNEPSPHTVMYRRYVSGGMYTKDHTEEITTMISVFNTAAPKGYQPVDPTYFMDVQKGSVNVLTIEHEKEIPLTPIEPGTPVEPPEEETPITPIEPGTPVEPPEEEIPITPIEPGTPIEPPKEEIPWVPIEPGTPIEPPKEEIPWVPIEPGTPIEPPKEEIPWVPIEPGTPIEPPKEEIPWVPIEPGTPIEPPKEEIPWVPIEPGTPIEPPKEEIPWVPIERPQEKPTLPLIPLRPAKPTPIDPEADKPLEPILPPKEDENESLEPILPPVEGENETLEPVLPPKEDESLPLDPADKNDNTSQDDKTSQDKSSAQDEKLPPTGVGSGVLMYGGIMIAAGVILAITAKKEEE